MYMTVLPFDSWCEILKLRNHHEFLNIVKLAHHFKKNFETDFQALLNLPNTKVSDPNYKITYKFPVDVHNISHTSLYITEYLVFLNIVVAKIFPIIG